MYLRVTDWNEIQEVLTSNDNNRLNGRLKYEQHHHEIFNRFLLSVDKPRIIQGVCMRLKLGGREDERNFNFKCTSVLPTKRFSEKMSESSSCDSADDSSLR